MASKIRVGLIAAMWLGVGERCAFAGTGVSPEFEVTAVATTKLESATATAHAFNIP